LPESTRMCYAVRVDSGITDGEIMSKVHIELKGKSDGSVILKIRKQNLRTPVGEYMD